MGTSNHFLDESGAFLARAPTPECGPLGTSDWDSNPLDPMALGWPDTRYFLLYDGGDHVVSTFLAPWRMTMDLPIANFIASVFPD